MIFDRQLQIWGSFGQRQLAQTKIYFLSSKESSLIQRTLELLKLSGVPEESIVFDPVAFETEMDHIFIVYYDSFNENFLKNISLNCPVIVFNGVNFRSFFSKRLYIDSNRKDLELNELINLLSDIKENNTALMSFCSSLLLFLRENERLPLIPKDLKHFNSLYFDAEEVIYLINSCKKFTILENNNYSDINLLEQDQSHCSILNESKSAALLSAEIQKIVTRKYLPETGTFTFKSNGEISIIKNAPKLLVPEMDKRKLESNYSVYIKIGEREYLGNNFGVALKSFKKAYELAKELGNAEDCIKTLDTQASCLERSGNINEAVNIATKLISNHKSSPVGYLRMGKLLRLQRDLEGADKFYKIGVVKADKKDKLYDVLAKQSDTVQKLLQTIKDDAMSIKLELGKEQIYGKGHLLSLPTNCLNRICSQSSKSVLKSFASTCNYSFSFVSKGLLTGSFGVTDLRLLKSVQLMSKLFKEFNVLESFNQSATLKINSETSAILFLMYLKKNMTNVKKKIRISNMYIGPIREESFLLFEECLSRGLNVIRLRMELKSTPSKQIEMKNLKELVIDNNDDVTNISASGLESLILNGEEGNREFSNCKSLKYLIYPKESNFNSFNSEKIILANLKYEQSVAMRPRPIQYLCLNGASNTLYTCVDLTQYSYESVKVLHLEGITLNSSTGSDLIKSSCWNNLECLRMTRLMLQNPQRDLNWILSKCPKGLKVLELVSLPLSGLNDFNTNENGAWLVDLILKQFPLLEHLILGDLTFGASANNLLMKSLVNNRLKRLKVFGMIRIQTIGYNFDQMYQTFRLTYPWSLLLLNDRQYIEYCEEYNLFKNGRTFITI